MSKVWDISICLEFGENRNSDIKPVHKIPRMQTYERTKSSTSTIVSNRACETLFLYILSMNGCWRSQNMTFNPTKEKMQTSTLTSYQLPSTTAECIHIFLPVNSHTRSIAALISFLLPSNWFFWLETTLFDLPFIDRPNTVKIFWIYKWISLIYVD